MKNEPSSNASKPATERRSDLNIRSTVAFNEWASRMAANQRVSVASLIEIALIDYSEKLGFEEEVPYRLPKHGRYD